MMEWMKIFMNDSLKFPNMVALIPSNNINPEQVYYYQNEASEYIRDENDKRPLFK